MSSSGTPSISSVNTASDHHHSAGDGVCGGQQDDHARWMASSLSTQDRKRRWNGSSEDVPLIRRSASSSFDGARAGLGSRSHSQLISSSSSSSSTVSPRTGRYPPPTMQPLGGQVAATSSSRSLPLNLPANPSGYAPLAQPSTQAPGRSSMPIHLSPSSSSSSPPRTSRGRTSGVPGSSRSMPIDLSSSPPRPLRRDHTLPQPPQVQQPQQPQQQQQQQQQQPRRRQPQITDYMSFGLPRWQPDSQVTKCPICGIPFSFWFRKHHCRKCGRVVCASCSPHRITIPRQFIVRPPGSSTATSSSTAASPVAGRDDPLSRINPALGGGEEVRLCNPCVPDPNPDPPRGFPALRGDSEYIVHPSGSQPRAYPMSLPSHQRPVDFMVSVLLDLSSAHTNLLAEFVQKSYSSGTSNFVR